MNKNELVLGKCPVNEGYTVYKNTDEEMVKQIKEMKVSKENFSTWNHKNCKIVQVLNDKQNLCQDEDGEFFTIDNDEIEDGLKDNLIEAINKKFDVVEVLNKVISPIYDRDGYMRIAFRGNPEARYDDLLRVGSTEVGYNISTYRGIELTKKKGEWGSLMFCHLNKDGNIVNRDYNLNITEHLNNKPKIKQDLADEIIKNIEDVPYLNYGDKWFNEKFAYVLAANIIDDDEDRDIMIFKLSKLDAKSNGNYGDRYEKAKMPKKGLIAVKKDHILSKILPIINTLDLPGENINLSKYFEFKEEQKIVPTKRIQETKINEKKYDVFDLTEDEDVLKEVELMEALRNIENSIEIPKNEEIAKEWIEIYLDECGCLPSFSFNKGEKQPDHSKYKGLVKMPHGCNFTFQVEEGDACEITWAHSIYETDIIGLELVQ
jgi:hypothetical protein